MQPQRQVPMTSAAEIIRATARPVGLHAPVIIGITGPVGAGKSTLASWLSPCVISTDHYLPDYDVVPEPERDLPERSDLARLLDDLHALKQGRVRAIPQWSFQSHSRVGEQMIHPAELIVVEGLHALHATHAAALDLRVYVDAPSDLRWKRWEHLERTGQRGWGVEVARNFFHAVAEPTFARSAEIYRAGADVVVFNDSHVPE